MTLPDDADPIDVARHHFHGTNRDDGAGARDERDDAPESPEARRRRQVRSAVEWVVVIGGALVVALLVRTFLFTTFWIPSGSMEPTLMGNGRHDRVVVNKIAYRIGEPERGDIIVFSLPPGVQVEAVNGQEVNDLIKRIVGLPGETITLRDGDVYVDGERLDEPYLPDGTETTATCGVDTFEVPEGAVFVMGDNRGASHDARCWEQHWVDEDTIVGKAILRIWPLGAFGRI
ncbi:MAG: signal peptidase I [Acidimicrobiales bacterium]|nr:signal peptidase I [Acidimicrobiales bacterium]